MSEAPIGITLDERLAKLRRETLKAINADIFGDSGVAPQPITETRRERLKRLVRVRDLDELDYDW
jgi:hypothetical protein